MSSRRQRDRQIKVALGQIEKMVRRRDVAGSVAALLAVPPDARSGASVNAVAALFTDEAARAHRRAAWSQLAQCALWAEREPRLVTAGGDPVIGSATRWALFWGLAHSAQWERTERMWAQIRDALGLPGDVVAVLDLWVAKRGRVDDEALVGLPLRSLPDKDQRLGYDERGPRARELPPPSLPRTLDEVDAAVLGACAGRAWRAFADVVTSWVALASEPVRTAICTAAGHLAVRELLLRARAQGTGPSASGGLASALREPAALLGKVVRAAAPEELAGGALLALRVALSASGTAPIDSAELGRDLAELSRTALRYPAHGPLIARTWQHTPLLPPACPAVLDLFEELIAAAPEVALRAKAVRVWARSGDEDDEDEDQAPPPVWLTRGVADALTRPAEILAWSRVADETHLTELLAFAGKYLPLAEVARFVDEAWQGAGPGIRRHLAEVMLLVLTRARELEPASGHTPSWPEIKALLERVESEMGPAPPPIRELVPRARHEPTVRRVLFELLGNLVDRRLPPEAVEVWRRFEARLLPCKEEFLCIGLELAPTAARRREVAERYLDGQRDIESRLAVLGHLSPTRDRRIAADLEARIVSDHRDDVPALARALRFLAAEEAPERLLLVFAAALIAADRANPGSRSDLGDHMLTFARQLVRVTRPARARSARPRRARSTSAKGPSAEKSPARSSRKSRARPAPDAASEAQTAARGGDAASEAGPDDAVAQKELPF